MKKLILVLAASGTLAACSDADVASSNLSKAADNFEVVRGASCFTTASPATTC